MGAWGFGSFDNDAAQDFLSLLVCEKAVTRALAKTDNYAEVRVAAEVLLHLSRIQDLWFKKETVEKMIRYLEGALENKMWLESWIDGGRAAKKSLRRLIGGLKRMEGY